MPRDTNAANQGAGTGTHSTDFAVLIEIFAPCQSECLFEADEGRYDQHQQGDTEIDIANRIGQHLALLSIRHPMNEHQQECTGNR